jgi:hypothetical protein
MDIVTKFSVGDRAYFSLFATATIYAVQIKRVYIRNNEVIYDIIRLDNNFVISGVKEAEIGTFTEAKTSLITYLQAKLNEITNLVAP